MDLLKDIRKAKTHFFAVTVRRNLASMTPRTFYTFVDAEVVPFSVLTKKFEHAGDLHGNSVNVMDVFTKNEAERIRDGGLGAVMVMTVELREGENKLPAQAVAETAVPIFQPLGLFKVHQTSQTLAALVSLVYLILDITHLMYLSSVGSSRKK